MSERAGNRRQDSIRVPSLYLDVKNLGGTKKNSDLVVCIIAIIHSWEGSIVLSHPHLFILFPHPNPLDPIVVSLGPRHLDNDSKSWVQEEVQAGVGL